MSILKKFFGQTTRYTAEDAFVPEPPKSTISDEEILATARFKPGDEVYCHTLSRECVGKHIITNPIVHVCLYGTKELRYLTDRFHDRPVPAGMFILEDELTPEQREELEGWVNFKAEFQVFRLWNGQHVIYFRSNFSLQKDWQPLRNCVSRGGVAMCYSGDPAKYTDLLFQTKEQAVQIVEVLTKFTMWEELEYFTPQYLISSPTYGTLVYEAKLGS